jgi:hypothetical protein
VLRTWREEIRLASGSKVYEIQQTTDTAALAAYITGPDYPAWPADPYQPYPEPPADDTISFEGGFTSGGIVSSTTL